MTRLVPLLLLACVAWGQDASTERPCDDQWLTAAINSPAPADYFWHVRLDTIGGAGYRAWNPATDSFESGPWTEWWLYLDVTTADTVRSFRVGRIEPVKQGCW